MNRTICVVEAYVPGLGARPEDWYERLQTRVATALRADGLEIALLAIPDDETLMWLVWGGLDQTDPAPAVAAVVLREATGARGVAVVERAVDARFVWPGSSPGGRGRAVS